MNGLPEVLVSARAAVRQRLSALSLRERQALGALLVVLLLAALLAVAVLPAWRTLSAAPQRQAELDQRMARMQQLAATAQALKDSGAAQAPAAAEVQRALEAATARLPNGARLNVGAAQATLTLRDTDPAALAAWIEQARVNARLTPRNADLRRGDDGRWSGTLVLSGTASDGN